ncbi:MAG TPA: tetratricopeptide repeat protein [Gemmataceae bacterium]|nr:tetratricopeptide repeat protein [Gemmataceae bacterium]
MRRNGILIAALTVGLTAAVGRAGVYDLDDPTPARYPPLPMSHDGIKLVLAPLRGAALPPPPPPDPDKRPYSVQAAELEKKGSAHWTTADRINLSACYIRMNRAPEAIQILTEADRTNYLVLANLAAAYQAINELQKAIDTETEALAVWPDIQAGWTNSQLTWYRRVEGYYLKLLQSRRDEPKPPTDMDAIFGAPLHRGAYGPEVHSWKLWDDLPPDAYAIVSQLLIWSPNDSRLYWQLAELLNTYGYVPDAVKIFDEISFGGSLNIEAFKSHRKALKNAAAEAGAVNELIQRDPAKFESDLYTLMWLTSPRGLLQPPLIGDTANEALLAAPVPAFAALYQQQQEQTRQRLMDQLRQMQPQQPAAPPAPAPAASGWADWRPLGIGFAAGLIVAVLAALQWTEWRRRRLAAPAGAPPPAPPPHQHREPAAHDAGAIRTDASPSPAAPDRLEGAP